MLYFLVGFSFLLPSDFWLCDRQSVHQVKGWTRSSVVATILLAASELDLTDAAAQEQVKPLVKIRDRAWLLPCHVAGWIYCCRNVFTLLLFVGSLSQLFFMLAVVLQLLRWHSE